MNYYYVYELLLF